MPRQNTEAYRMREDHWDPRLRPSVDHLLFQLRKHKALKDHPDAVAFIIKSISYHFFVRNDQQPELLWQTVGDMMHHFRGLMPGYDWVEEKMDEEVSRNSSGQALVRSDTWPYVRVATTAEEAAIAAEVTPAGYMVGDKGVATGGNILAEPPTELHDKVINFADQNLKTGVQDVILRHRPKPYANGQHRCYCGKFYPDVEGWANHVRVRVWRYFKNEFAPDSTDGGVQEVHSSEPAGGNYPDAYSDQSGTIQQATE